MYRLLRHFPNLILHKAFNLLALMLVLMTACTRAETGTPAPAPTTPEIYQQAPLREFLLAAYNPPYAWHGPPYEDSVFAYYQEAGFDTLLWARDDEALMQKVHAFGFKYLLDVGAIIGEDALRGSPDTPAPPIEPAALQELDAAIERYKDDPALIGYYICDEPYPSAFQNIAVVVQRIREKDPAHFSFVNLWPYFEGEIGGDEYIEDFIQTTHIRLLSSDRYNFFTDWDDNEGYFDNLERIRRHALAHHIPFVNIIQAVGTEGTSVGTPGGADEYLEWRTPNQAEHRWLVYSSLTYGVHGIIWFHWDHEWGVTGNPDREIIYPAIQSLNREIAALKDIMFHLTTTRVWHTDRGEDNLPVTAPDGTALLVGLFQDKTGSERYFMLMNKDYSAPVQTEIALNAAISRLRVFDVQSGQWEDVPFSAADGRTTFTLQLRPGGGKLFVFAGAALP